MRTLASTFGTRRRRARLPAPAHARLRMRAAARTPSSRSRAAFAIGAVIAVGCVHEPLPFVCADAAVGELVITELRGPQSTPNSLPQWIEIANVSDHAIALDGLHLRLSYRDGSGARDMVIRRERSIAAGEYFVFAFVPENQVPDGMDYGLAGEYDGDLYGGGVLLLESCDEIIDKLDWTELPTNGTWALGGTPSADANDMDAAWCADEHEPDGAMVELGAPGTPGEANPPCP
ncbi:MAG: hypothetical protein IPK74_17325 [Deltaproteobacteria bacterium]|nr:hypothetical protein [Deltaproteobacteria bacterium]